MKTIKVPQNTQIAVFTDPHEHSEHFFSLMDKINPSEKMWIVCCGDYFDKGWGNNHAFLIIDKIIEYSNSGFGFSVKGNHDYKYIKKHKKENYSQSKWLNSLPLSLFFEFYNGTKLTILHAGITPTMTSEDLLFSSEVLYIRDIDENNKMIPLIWKEINGEKILVKTKDGGKSWHYGYDGRFGYIVAGHDAQKDSIPKFYNYSCNLDSAVFETGILSAQIFTSEGKLGELIQVSGTAFNSTKK